MIGILRRDTINEAYIVYCGQRAKVNCDRNCRKAWGINNRPSVQLSEDEDDTAFLADDVLAMAPKNPGTYEGRDGKPYNPDEFPNKWCVRECERSNMSNPGEWMNQLEVKSFGKRRYNQP